MRFLKLIQALLNRFHKTTYTMVIHKKKMKEIIKIRVCEAEKNSNQFEKVTLQCALLQCVRSKFPLILHLHKIFHHI